MILYDKVEKLFSLVPELREMRDQKELYMRFNKAPFEDMSEVEQNSFCYEKTSYDHLAQKVNWRI